MSHPTDIPCRTSPAKPRLAATTVLVRDGENGLEVLLIRRPPRSGDRHGGGYVFPGGTVDPSDRACYSFCDGLDDIHASARLGVPEFGLDLYVAAIRECFEEVGILLADESSERTPGMADASPAEMLALRRRLIAGEVTFGGVCARLGLRLSPTRLAYQAHWLTPASLPKRFDTRFFIVQMPDAASVVEDGSEATAHCWIHPEDALARAEELALPNPTRATFGWLRAFSSARECVAAANGLERIEMVAPVLADGPQGIRPLLPHEAPYAEGRKIDDWRLGQARYAIEADRRFQLSDRVYRLAASNPGFMTGPGTNTYFIQDPGSNDCAVIDPGPDDPAHIDAIVHAAPGRIRWILVTHTHRDHSSAACPLAQRCGGELMGMPAPDAPRQDATFSPQRLLVNDDVVVLGSNTSLRVLHTPGHASNHLCYLLQEERLLFTGDQVMQGSSVVISPPDGNMAAYVDSLRRLLHEDLEWLAPGHGFLIAKPHEAINSLIEHRLRREGAVMNALRAMPNATLDQLLDQVYKHVPPQLRGAARRSLRAHLQKLESEGWVELMGDSWFATGTRVGC